MNSRGLKEKLSALSDLELYNLISAVALASGIDKARAQALCSDIPRLRRMIASLSDEQISVMLRAMGNGADLKRFLGDN